MQARHVQVCTPTVSCATVLAASPAHVNLYLMYAGPFRASEAWVQYEGGPKTKRYLRLLEARRVCFRFKSFNYNDIKSPRSANLLTANMWTFLHTGERFRQPQLQNIRKLGASAKL